MRVLEVQWSRALSVVCEVALRASLDYGEKNALVKNFRGMEQYDWLRNGFFIGKSLYNGQDFFVWRTTSIDEK